LNYGRRPALKKLEGLRKGVSDPTLNQRNQEQGLKEEEKTIHRKRKESGGGGWGNDAFSFP